MIISIYKIDINTHQTFFKKRAVPEWLYKMSVLMSVIFFSFSNINAQNVDVFKKKDVDRINKRTAKMFKRSDCYSSSSNIKMTNIFLPTYEGDYSKEEFLSSDFFSNIKPRYFYRKLRKYPSTRTLIYSNEGNLLAVSDGRYIFCTKKYTTYAEDSENMLQIIIDLDLKNVYTIYWLIPTVCIYIGIDEKNMTYVLVEKNREIQYYLLEDYVNNHWEELPKLWDIYTGKYLLDS